MRTHDEAVSRYPLAWPMGWVRAKSRKRAAFQKRSRGHSERALTVHDAVNRLNGELSRLGARNVTLSTNIELRLDGWPRSNQGEPRDPGAAVYFSFRGKATVFACDRYDRVADNIAAIAKHIEALRAIERYGVGSLDQALAGYKALPADTAADWRAVLGFPSDARPSNAEIDSAFKALTKLHHPDRGGSEEKMIQVNRAREFALAEMQL